MEMGCYASFVVTLPIFVVWVWSLGRSSVWLPPSPSLFFSTNTILYYCTISLSLILHLRCSVLSFRFLHLLLLLSSGKLEYILVTQVSLHTAAVRHAPTDCKNPHCRTSARTQQLKSTLPSPDYHLMKLLNFNPWEIDVPSWNMEGHLHSTKHAPHELPFHSGTVGVSSKQPSRENHTHLR